ncbi:uncharacterized protein LOC125034819 isoform X5 [Penaeus chinensis]|uniref:uncharacterized protein LOC125034819 isoform X5 n=1 Tax=Penaeus chinensis TaxID=139456 RepID=UPI001FB68B09|nr:uncharacterized protein LOC125034819 isoform X5 [Penaeus chinensis]
MNHWYQRREQAMTQLFHKDLRSVGHGAEISVTDGGPPVTLTTRMTSRTTWFAYKCGLVKPRRRRNASALDSEPRGGPCVKGVKGNAAPSLCKIINHRRHHPGKAFF